MNNNVWLVIKQEDYFYDDKYYNVDVFKTKEDAKKYFEDYVDILLYELECDYNDRKRETDWTFEEAVEIERKENYANIYLDDFYYITIEIEKKEIMRMG